MKKSILDFTRITDRKEKGVQHYMLKAKKDEKKVAVSFRISEDLYVRMKKLKTLSKTKGYIFTVQAEIEKYLEKQVKEAEEKLQNMNNLKVKE